MPIAIIASVTSVEPYLDRTNVAGMIVKDIYVLQRLDRLSNEGVASAHDGGSDLNVDVILCSREISKTKMVSIGSGVR